MKRIFFLMGLLLSVVRDFCSEKMTSLVKKEPSISIAYKNSEIIYFLNNKKAYEENISSLEESTQFVFDECLEEKSSPIESIILSKIVDSLDNFKCLHIVVKKGGIFQLGSKLIKFDEDEKWNFDIPFRFVSKLTFSEDTEMGGLQIERTMLDEPFSSGSSSDSSTAASPAINRKYSVGIVVGGRREKASIANDTLSIEYDIQLGSSPKLEINPLTNKPFTIPVPLARSFFERLNISPE